jgi:serine protease Do
MSPHLLTSCLLLAWSPAQEPAPQPPTASAADAVAALENVIADAIAKAEPSVVAIHRSKVENSHSQETQAVRGRKRVATFRELPRPFGFERRLPREFEQPDFVSFDFGSGVVIGDHGEILTLYHVVKGARELKVRAAGRQEFEAEIIAADPRSDLAVIAPVEGDMADRPRLKPLAIGDATRLRKGSFLIALGNPFNAARDGKASASWGILSNVARWLEPDIDDSPRQAKQHHLNTYATLLQLDSKLNLGMSGGAVVNLKGELVAVTTTASSPEGFDAMAGYAIPMDRLGRRVVETLKQGKEVEYGLLGVNADRGVARPANRVIDTVLNSPASYVLQANDEIIAVDGVPIGDFESLILAINAYTAGDTVKLKIKRGDEVIERTLVLAKFPVDGEVIASNRPNPWRGLRIDYTTAVYRTVGRQLLDSGVVVTEVEEGSAAAIAGLKKGMIIQRVGDTPLRSPREFYAAVAGQKGAVVLETSDRVKITVN